MSTRKMPDAASAVLPQKKITVYRRGDTLLVRSPFSEKKDLLQHIFPPANEKTYLISKRAPITSYARYHRIHCGGDDFPANWLDHYGHVAGNHGSVFARILHVSKHGLRRADIGSRLTDAEGSVYYIMYILGANRFMIHPESTGKPGFPVFKKYTSGKLFKDGKELKVEKSEVTQMRPLLHFNRVAYLVDGKTPLPEKKLVQCEYIDKVMDADLVMTEALVDAVKKNPGKPYDIGAKGLPLLLNTKMLYRFQPYGACTVDWKMTIAHDIKNLIVYLTVFGWDLGKNWPYKIFYIPKLKPFTVPDWADKKKSYDFDFSAKQVVFKDRKYNIDFNITRKQCLDPDDLPDRFVNIGIKNDKPAIGFALGYSLLNGVTAKKNKGRNRPFAYYLWHSWKLYPRCVTVENVKKGQTFDCRGYRQYFNPALEPDATSFYHHREGDSELVYLDFHKSLDKKLIKLPADFAGKKISIVEKTPSVTLHAADAVPAKGILLSVKNDYGYIVLKLD